MKIFEFQKSRFFHQSCKNLFLSKTKSPNKKRSADLKSASKFNYVPETFSFAFATRWERV